MLVGPNEQSLILGIAFTEGVIGEPQWRAAIASGDFGPILNHPAFVTWLLSWLGNPDYYEATPAEAPAAPGTIPDGALTSRFPWWGAAARPGHTGKRGSTKRRSAESEGRSAASERVDRADGALGSVVTEEEARGYLKLVGQRLAAVRVAQGLSRRQFAKLSGLSLATIGRSIDASNLDI